MKKSEQTLENHLKWCETRFTFSHFQQNVKSKDILDNNRLFIKTRDFIKSVEHLIIFFPDFAPISLQQIDFKNMEEALMSEPSDETTREVDLSVLCFESYDLVLLAVITILLVDEDHNETFSRILSVNKGSKDNPLAAIHLKFFLDDNGKFTVSSSLTDLNHDYIRTYPIKGKTVEDYEKVDHYENIRAVIFAVLLEIFQEFDILHTPKNSVKNFPISTISFKLS